MAKLLIIDDERGIRNTLREILADEGHEVDVAENGKQGLEMARAKAYDLIFSDIKMPEMDGMEVLTKLKGESDEEFSSAETPVVMISGHGDVETAVQALKSGAYDFLLKPLDLNRILITTKNALESKNLRQETKQLRKKIIAKGAQMIGESAAITHVREIIDKVAPTEARVLITGQNGTGKEVVAHMIHEQSARANGPMVEVNCAAIPSASGERDYARGLGQSHQSECARTRCNQQRPGQRDSGRQFPRRPVPPIERHSYSCAGAERPHRGYSAAGGLLLRADLRRAGYRA